MTTTPQPPGTVIIHACGRTDVGRAREHNEDALLIADLTTGRASADGELRDHHAGARGTLFMVADGLGGAASGEIASGMATDVILEELRSRWTNTAAVPAGAASGKVGAAFAAALKGAAETANARIHAYALEHPEHKGMGTTVTLAGLLGETLYLGQVGDSRAYIIRNGHAEQITKDQSLMQRLVEAGEMTPEEAEQSERRNIILQALGPEALVRIDLTHQPVRRGDVLVLCTDGLSGLVRREEIAAVVGDGDDLAAAADRLIAMANENGGPDNITVVLARFDGDVLQRPTSEDSVGHQAYSISGSAPAVPGAAPARARALGAQAPEAPGTAPRREVPAALQGNMPYLIAGIAALIVLLVLLFARLRDSGVLSAPPGPARDDSAAATPSPMPSRTP
ncbi:MAG: protein phosphatase 2C domain-containing protein [Gemmatimonadaceae bacterium]